LRHTLLGSKVVADFFIQRRKSLEKVISRIGRIYGARLGELAQIRKQGIKFYSDSDRNYNLITDEAGDVKNKNAV